MSLMFEMLVLIYHAHALNYIEKGRSPFDSQYLVFVAQCVHLLHFDCGEGTVPRANQVVLCVDFKWKWEHNFKAYIYIYIYIYVCLHEMELKYSQLRL